MSRTHTHGGTCCGALTSPSGFGAFDASAGGLKWLLEPAPDAETPGVRVAVSENLAASLVHADSAERCVRWVEDADLDFWGVTRDSVTSAAAQGLDALLDELSWRPRPVTQGRAFQLEGRTLFRASMICAPAFAGQAFERLGPALFAVAPTPELVIVFDDLGALGTLGPELLRAWARAPERLSLEVLAHAPDAPLGWRVAGTLESA
jgi:hypothetical protein